MDDRELDNLIGTCDCGRYPQEFLADYEPFECLAAGDACETLLVKHKRTGVFYVAKCYVSGSAVSHAGEAEILKMLRHPGLPRFMDEYKDGDTLCVVRDYVEGTPLDRWAAQKKPDMRDVVRVAMALCGLLTYLHSQTPPIIHRDVKPQNLIVGTDGQLWLIDFGISRLYREEGKTDTTSWGTQDFAAPEQYGFAQTDVRSDLYSFGVLLGWLLTGETKRENALPKIADHRLRRIVEKCTAFAPKERYTSAAKICADLAALDGRRRRWTLRIVGVIALCALCLCGGFALGRWSGVLSPRDSGVAFTEPLIGQAVRLMLDHSGVPVSQTDLLSVTELYIFGDQPAKNNADYQMLPKGMAEGAPAANGGITTLDDLAMMPNLSIVRLSLQNIEDLSPLAGLHALRELDLRHNPLADAAPLAGLLQLRKVSLYDTRISDLSPFAACPLLSELGIGKTFVTSLAGLEGSAGLTRLTMFDTPLETLQGIEALKRLSEIKVSDVADGDLTPLLALPNLQSAVLSEALKSLAQDQLGEAKFQMEYRAE